MNIADTPATDGNTPAGTDCLGALAIDIVPDIGRWLFGANAEKTAVLVAQAVESVTATTDATIARGMLQSDPRAISQLRLQLISITAQQQAEADRASEAQQAASLAAIQAAADRASASNQTTMLARLHNRMAWAPVILSAIILIVFGVLIDVVLTKTNLTAESLPLANVLLGTVAAMATQVANYWLGSSSGSAAKSEQMAVLSAAAQSSVPGDLVHRLIQQPAVKAME